MLTICIIMIILIFPFLSFAQDKTDEIVHILKHMSTSQDDLYILYSSIAIFIIVLLFIACKFRRFRSASVVSVVYLVIGVIWILLSDTFVDTFFTDYYAHKIQTYKGLFFVLISALLIFLLIRISFRRLSRSEVKYRETVESIPHGVIEVNVDGVVCNANTYYHDMFGFKTPELIGKKLWDLMPNREAKRLKVYFKKSQVNSLGPTSWSSLIKTKRGRHLNIQVDWNWKRNSSNTVIKMFAIVTNVTDKKENQKRQYIANQILNYLNEEEDTSETVKKCLQLIKDTFFINVAAIRLNRNKDFTATALRLKYENSYPYYQSEGLTKNHLDEDNHCLISDRETIDPDSPIYRCLCGCVISKQQSFAKDSFTEYGTFWTNDLLHFMNHISDEFKEEVEFHSHCLEAGYKSLALIPLRIKDDVMGILQLCDRRRDAFNENTISYFEGLADSISIAFDRKWAYERLKINEHTLKGIFDAVPVGVGIVELPDRIIRKVNPYIETMLETSVEKLINQSARILYPNNEEYDIVGRDKHSLIKRHGIGSVESKWVKSDGDIVDIILSSAKIGDSDDIVFTAMDITDKKKIDQALIKSEKKYRGLFDNMLDGFALHEVIVDRNNKVVDYRFLTVNPAFEKITGLKKEDVEGKRVGEVLPNIEQHWIDRIGNVGLTGESDFFEEDSVDLGGRTFELTAYSPKEMQCACLFQDVTERKIAQTALKDSENRFKAAFNTSPDLIIITEIKSGKYLYVNDGFVNTTGYTRDEVIGKSSNDFHLHSDSKHRAETYELLDKHQEITNLETHIVNKAGRKLDILLSAKMLPMDNISHAIFVIRDVTDWKKDQKELIDKEQQLRRIVKMEAVGTLAGGIAHDFNNILQIIGGNVQLMALDTDDTQKIDQFDVLSKAVNRGASLVRSLLTFSRKVESNLKPNNINELIKVSHKLLDRVAVGPVKIDLKLVLDANLDRVMADSSQIDQVITNLVLNAKDAMPQGGKITIATSMIYCDELFCSTHPDLKSGDYIVITVSDSGTGISKDNIDRIFDPFFTTKEMGKGTGLGLAVVYGIIKNHDGYISCYSEKGLGTEFKIYLKSIGKDLTIEEIKERNTSIVGGTETILIIDDEEPIRVLAESIFKKYGYTTISCESGEVGLKYYLENKDLVDLIVLDLIMPGISGTETLKALKTFDSDVKVVVASGYSINGYVKDALKQGAKSFIPKPYTLKTLLGEVRKILDE